jgi:hypothetical protein
MRYLLLLLLTLLCSCSTFTATKGNLTVSRTSFGVNTGLPVLIIDNKSDTEWKLTVKGLAQNETDTIAVAVKAAIEGMAEVAK